MQRELASGPPNSADVAAMILADTRRLTVLGWVLDERYRQDAKWGDADGRRLPLPTWMVVLGEEYGEVCKAILHGPIEGRQRIREELIQVAAVAVAMLESLDNAPFGIKAEDAG